MCTTAFVPASRPRPLSGGRVEWRKHAGPYVWFRCIEHRNATKCAILVKEHIAEVCPANIDCILKYGLKDRLQLT